jgi:hypothetical protein
VIYIYNYDKDGYFKCDNCGEPLYDGDPYIVIDSERICMNCINDMIRYASFEDSDECEYQNRIQHERSELNGF